MSRRRRIASEARAEMRSFTRKPAAVFFTFVFPVILVGLFAVVVEAESGLFARSQAHYLPGYLAFVVLLTPLSRLSSTVARGRDHRRFEKLATTPLTRWEWVFAHTSVNFVLIAAAAALIAAVTVAFGGVEIVYSPLAAVFVLLGVVAFCGLGVVIGRVTGSEDGAIAMSNGVGFPVLFLGDTFLEPSTLPESLSLLVELLPLTYFSRGFRAATVESGGVTTPLLLLAGFAAAGFLLAGLVLPWRT